MYICNPVIYSVMRNENTNQTKGEKMIKVYKHNNGTWAVDVNGSVTCWDSETTAKKMAKVFSEKWGVK